MREKTIETLLTFSVIFAIAVFVIHRTEHQERMKVQKELLKALEENSSIVKEEIVQYKMLIKEQYKTNALIEVIGQ